MKKIHPYIIIKNKTLQMLRSELALFVLRHIPLKAGIAIRKLIYRHIMRNFSGASIDHNVFINSPENISILDDTTISINSYIMASEGELYIGKNLSAAHNSTINASHGTIIIENNVSIGPNTVLRAGIHRYGYMVDIKKSGHKRCCITLEEGCWIASNVVIAGNVTIGKGAVIGAGSFVNKDIPAYHLAAGAPAKIIKNLREQK